MTIDQQNAERMGRTLAGAIHEHWALFLIEGIILVILGIAAIALPPIATLALTIIIGWVFLISGGVGLFTTFWARHVPGFWWSLISAIIGIAAGVVLLLWPDHGQRPRHRALHGRCVARPRLRGALFPHLHDLGRGGVDDRHPLRPRRLRSRTRRHRVRGVWLPGRGAADRAPCQRRRKGPGAANGAGGVRRCCRPRGAARSDRPGD